MFIGDILFILTWWLVFLLVGVVFLPLTMLIFSRFVDLGYVFSKILGILIVSYTIFALGTFKILPFTHTVIILLLFVFAIASVSLFAKVQHLSRLNLRSIPWRFFIFEELLFLAGIIFWSYIRAHEPSIHGLEKFMDFGFVNSILRADYFPAKDLWLTPFSINYYYFGHVVTAVLTKLSGIDPAVTYNLMIATLFAFTFTGAFSIGLNLFNTFLATPSKTPPRSHFVTPRGWPNGLPRGGLLAGLLAGFLVSLAGNLHTIYAFFAPYNGENPVPFWNLAFGFNFLTYWYPNATRFIPFTIHEFPIYSFVVSDLHGHVLSIPIVLTIIAVLLSLIFNFQFSIFNQIKNSFQISNFKFQILLLSFLLAAAYMTNAWDGIVYFLLAALVIVFVNSRFIAPTVTKGSIKYYVLGIMQNRKYILHTTYYILLLLIGAILFSLPFSLHFKPFVSGIGIICAPEFLIKIGKLGPFLFETNHCQRSPLWQLLILHGFWYFWVISFLVFLKLNAKRYSLNAADIFVLLLIGLSTLLLLLPEFIYAKDIYPAHYRANTMFKLGYEAFMMLGISTAYIISRLVSSIKYYVLGINITNKILATCYIILATFLLFLVGIYPYFAINSYYGNLRSYRGLDGLVYLKDLYPTDYEAILWIRENIKGQPVILEGAGESYTDYARVSSNTGLPTVVGWPVHEWLWRGTYDEAGKRVSEVERIYTTKNILETRLLLEKYKVDYVFIGALERQKYPSLNEENFKMLGRPIYQNGQTTIYELK